MKVFPIKEGSCNLTSTHVPQNKLYALPKVEARKEESKKEPNIHEIKENRKIKKNNGN